MKKIELTNICRLDDGVNATLEISMSGVDEGYMAVDLRLNQSQLERLWSAIDEILPSVEVAL